MSDAGFSYSFAPIADDRAHLLILGSLPGKRSLEESRYYAFPNNAFWPIVSEILKLPENLDYEARCAAARAHGLAIWDVVAAAVRPGSLDAAIRKSDVRANDFAKFLADHRAIRAIFFNGKTAESLFRTHVLKALPDEYAALHYATLPSTSPAHASLTRADKLRVWRAALNPWLDSKR